MGEETDGEETRLVFRGWAKENEIRVFQQAMKKVWRGERGLSRVDCR